MQDLVALSQLDYTKANTIYQSIKLGLMQYGIAIKNCKGQAYDGAAAFQGHIRGGVAKKFEDINSAALSVHCLAHCVT